MKKKKAPRCAYCGKRFTPPKPMVMQAPWEKTHCCITCAVIDR